MPSAEVVVADAGPLIALARIDALNLLAGVFEQTLVTDTVLAECLARPDRPEGVAIRAATEAGWLIQEADPPAGPDWGLGAGETSALGLALARGAVILADDRAARRVATWLGVPVVGVLGLLVMARRQGRVSAIRPLIQTLVDSGYFLAGPVIEDVLRRSGE